MEFGQPKPLTGAIGVAHELRGNGASIDTITRALNKAGFPECAQKSVEAILRSGEGRGLKPEDYQRRPIYLED